VRSYAHKCTQCPNRFDSARRLGHHMNRCHGPRAKVSRRPAAHFECVPCDMYFTSQAACDAHKLRLHRSEAAPSEKSPIQCPVCRREFSTMALMRAHRHTTVFAPVPADKVACPICRTLFFPVCLALHIQAYHS
jgi:hypothetical protein